MNLQSLSEIIEEAPVSLSELARGAGVSYSAVRRWMQRNKIPAARVYDIAKILGVEVDDLYHLVSKDNGRPRKYGARAEWFCRVFNRRSKQRPVGCDHDECGLIWVEG